MKNLLKIAWDRFNINSAIVADLNGRFVSTLFYCTIFVPFGALSALFMDPLRIKCSSATWLKREPLPSDVGSARQQG